MVDVERLERMMCRKEEWCVGKKNEKGRRGVEGVFISTLEGGDPAKDEVLSCHNSVQRTKLTYAHPSCNHLLKMRC